MTKSNGARPALIAGVRETDQQCAIREREERMEEHHRAVRVREALHEVLLAAGVSGLTPLIDAGNPLDEISLPSLSAEKGWVVAALLRRSLAVEFGVADMLRAAFKANSVDVDVRVVDQRIAVGGISVAGADRIAVVLGAPDKYSDFDDAADFDDSAVGLDVAARLDEVFSHAAGAHHVTDFRPGTFGGGTPSVIRLGELDLEAARTIAMRLNPGVAW